MTKTKKEKHHLGVGATVSFQSKFLHPKHLRDEHLAQRPMEHRLADAIVTRREILKINHKDTMCAIVHHDDFKDSQGIHQELWCAEKHIKVHKEGDPNKFFYDCEEASPTPSVTEKVDETVKDDDIEMQNDTEKKDKHHHQRHHYHHGKNKRVSIDPDGFDDPLKPREGRDLMWRNVNMTVAETNRNNTKGKKILDGVWGDVPKKQCTAIMGPSGSGKTSLLNILAGRAASQGKIHIDADIRLNNYAVDPTRMEVRNKIAFVAQDDSLQVTATPREAIRFSAKMRLPRTMNDDALDNLTESMLEELGLMSCADVLVGGALLKGLSGGERKRTSVGEFALVTLLAVIFFGYLVSHDQSNSFDVLCRCRIGHTSSTGLSR
jgi:ABC-type lipoprotein export system ATPase subunit